MIVDPKSSPDISPETDGSQVVLGISLPEVLDRMGQGSAVRRKLRPWGRLLHDRAMPFLCLYRKPLNDGVPQAEHFATGEARYLLAPGHPEAARSVSAVVEALVEAGLRDFGSFLLLELSVHRPEGTSSPDQPLFRIVREKRSQGTDTAEVLESGLTQLTLPEFVPSVEVVTRTSASPSNLPPLLRNRKRFGDSCLVLGLEIQPIYIDFKTERFFPLVHRRLRDGVSRVIRQTAFYFTLHHTKQQPPHFHVLGRRQIAKAVWDVDEQLAALNDRFDLLLLTTPRNAEEAWREFRRSRYEKQPHFSYRPIPLDPALAKREIFQVPIERIEDPTLAHLFREQQDELDRKVTMLTDRNTPRFLQESLQLFGGVDDDLFQKALHLLGKIPSRTREKSNGKLLRAGEFAALAHDELEHLRSTYPELRAKVKVRSDVSGLMVSRGNLLVGKTTTIPASRVAALLQHEIGTHVITYYNGDAQRLRQLRGGLPSYEELQEGIAVLAEHLVGGMSRARLRLLAARVLAVRRMIEGASFIEVFRILDREYDFARHAAFTITMRVFRAGGQAKDAVYLRGLVNLLHHLESGGELEPLLIGKVGLHHIPMIEELKWRKVLIPPPLRPRYLDLPEAKARLERVRKGIEILDLAQ